MAILSKKSRGEEPDKKEELTVMETAYVTALAKLAIDKDMKTLKSKKEGLVTTVFKQIAPYLKKDGLHESIILPSVSQANPDIIVMMQGSKPKQVLVDTWVMQLKGILSSDEFDTYTEQTITLKPKALDSMLMSEVITKEQYEDLITEVSGSKSRIIKFDK